MVLFIMIPNSPAFDQQKDIKPLTETVKIDLVPFDFQRQTDHSFLYVDIRQGITTNILELSFTKDGKTVSKRVQEFMGIYQYCCFGDQHAFIMNREGDIIYYNLVNKDSFFVEKQHPSPFSPLQIHNIGEHFVTCGGNIKGSVTENQMVLKVWHFQNDQLCSKARVITGHSRPIQNSLMLGHSRVVSLSTDNSLRVTNLVTEQLEQVVRTNKDYYAGCQLGENIVLLGGTGRSLDLMDIRSRRLVASKALQNHPTIQICQMARLNENEMLYADVNILFSMDLRSFGVLQKCRYDGQRMSAIKKINESTLVLGNRDKTFQLWNII